MISDTTNAGRTLWPRFVPVVTWMGVIFAFSDQEKLPKPPGLGMDVTSVAGHLALYAVLAALCWWAIAPLDISPRTRTLLAFALAVLYGVTDEWHQSFVPGRTPDIWDLVVDAIGAAIGIAIAIRINGFASRNRD